jgi:transcriptional regulator with XRE-family HTH domain
MGRDGQVSALALFSEELRRARSAAGLTQDQLAERVGYSPSLVAHVETGSRAPSLDFARRGDEALGTGGLLARLQPFVRSEAYPAWFRDWVEVEREAVSLRWFEPLLIPGLLQTEEYARAVLAAAHPASPEEEVERLVKAARRPRVVLQVVPFGTGAHAGLDGRFAIASFDGPADVAYLDNALAGQVAERAQDVARLTLLYDILKAEALSPRASADLARKAIEQWT